MYCSVSDVCLVIQGCIVVHVGVLMVCCLVAHVSLVIWEASHFLHHRPRYTPPSLLSHPLLYRHTPSLRPHPFSALSPVRLSHLSCRSLTPPPSSQGQVEGKWRRVWWERDKVKGVCERVRGRGFVWERGNRETASHTIRPTDNTPSASKPSQYKFIHMYLCNFTNTCYSTI